MNNLIINKKPRTYIPEDLKMEWDSLSPILDELLKRDINNVKELEKWVEERLNNLERKIENNHRDILNKFEDLFKRLK